MALKIVRQFRAVFRLAAREQVLAGPGMPQHHNVRHHDRERFAVLDHAGQRDTADVDPVIGPLARDKTDALTISAGAVVRHHHLQGGVDRLGTGIGEEDVIERLRQDLGQLRGKGERRRLARLERRDIVVFLHLCIHRVRNLLAAVAGRHVEQPGTGVDQPVAVLVPKIHAVAFCDQTGSILEFAVRRERHPMLFQRVRREALLRFATMFMTVLPMRTQASASHSHTMGE